MYDKIRSTLEARRGTVAEVNAFRESGRDFGSEAGCNIRLPGPGVPGPDIPI